MVLGDTNFRKLIPLLHPRTRIQDMDVLKTWYEAVEDVLRPELTADLLAVWIYGPDGEPILIEPEALGEDHLEIPRADPIANQHRLDELEDRIRRAGYGSVLLRPIRHGGQDAGLILLASFQPHIYGLRAENLIDTATDVMAPMLARVARAGTGAEDVVADHAAAPVGEVQAPVSERVRDQAREGELFESLADAIGGAGTPRDLMLAVSFALQGMLPHDSYELLIPDGGNENYYRLGLHGHGTLWGDPSLVLSSAVLRPAELLGDHPTVLIDDAESSPETRMPELITVRGPEESPRSLVGVRLRVLERPVGYLFLGSNGPGFYREEDAAMLDRVGSLLAPRIEGMVLAWQYSVLRSQFDVVRHVPMHLARVAELLATTPFLGEGAKLFKQQAGAMLPITDLEFAVRLGEEQRVAVVKPGSTTPLADLPQEPIETAGVAAVVRGEVAFLLTSQEDEGGPSSVLVVPLRVGGRIFGAMAMTAGPGSAFSRADTALAQQLADLVAPHLDLARRAGGQAPPFLPGWKRPTLRPERGSWG